MREIYERAIEILEQGWSKNYYSSKIVNGNEVMAAYDDATNFCIAGALTKSAEGLLDLEYHWHTLTDPLCAFLLKRKGSGSIVRVNDKLEDGHEAANLIREFLDEGNL